MAPCKTGSAGARGEGSAGNFLPAVGRNSIYGDANYGIDLRIARCFHLTERLRMAILGEGLNVFNRANSNGYNSTAFNSVATTPLSAPLSLTANSNLRVPNNDGSQPDGTHARRIQLSLRFKFQHHRLLARRILLLSFPAAIFAQLRSARLAGAARNVA